MSSSTTAPLLDHIVILVPHSFLISPPSWFADQHIFHFYPGGRHADGRTENTLVLLADGSYLEFIAFVPGLDPKQRATHKWGKKKEGTVVDWALTLPSSSDGVDDSDVALEQSKELKQEKAFRENQRRVRDADAGIRYGDLNRGGRTRPDGEVLRWAVAGAERTSGDGLIEPGTVPFWCLDVTPRQLRVPYLEPGASKHPCGAVGVAGVEVFASPKDEVTSFKGVYNVLLGKVAASSAGSWKMGTLGGSKVHPGSVVSLGPAEERDAVNIRLSLFTADERWTGVTVGGEVDEEHSLEIKLEGVSSQAV